MHRPISRLVSDALVVLIGLIGLAGPWASPELASQPLDIGAYRQLLIDYRAGARDEAIARLAAAGSRSLQERNDVFLGGLDLDRPDEQRLWLAAMLVHAELATLPGPPEASDRFMDEFQRMTVVPGVVGGVELQTTVHLAAAYRLYSERRIVDALRLLTPAASRYPDHIEVQRAYGRLLEVVGTTHSRAADLEGASRAYRRVLAAEPADLESRVRFGRVLRLLGRSEEAIGELEAAVSGLDRLGAEADPAIRLVALLALGDGLRDQGSLNEALAMHERAHRQAPFSQPSRVALAMTLREMGRSEEAQLAIFEGASRRLPHGQRPLWNEYLMAGSGTHRALWGELWERLR